MLIIAPFMVIYFFSFLFILLLMYVIARLSLEYALSGLYALCKFYIEHDNLLFRITFKVIFWTIFLFVARYLIEIIASFLLIDYH